MISKRELATINQTNVHLLCICHKFQYVHSKQSNYLCCECLRVTKEDGSLCTLLPFTRWVIRIGIDVKKLWSLTSILPFTEKAQHYIIQGCIVSLVFTRLCCVTYLMLACSIFMKFVTLIYLVCQLSHSSSTYSCYTLS